jgi:ADP-ribosylglycohydrolase
MLGAIIGDIVGSVYEFKNLKSKDFPLFQTNCRYTDDTVMTCAVALALMNDQPLDETMQKFGQQFFFAGYGGYFKKWILAKKPEPYGSFGNGSGMRVSSVGWLYNDLDTVLQKAKETAEVTHNHEEGIKGAQAIAAAIFLARTGSSIQDIENYIQEHFYALDFTLDQIRPAYRFEVSCQKSVPQAITAFLESTSFEDAIRNAVSIGGDSDTIAAMAGSIAETFYGIPQEIADQAMTYLHQDLLDVVKAFQQRTGKDGN